MTIAGRIAIHDTRSLLVFWSMSGAVLVCCAFALSAGSSQFAYTVSVAERPIGSFVAGYMLAGAIFLAVTWYLVPRSLSISSPTTLLVLMIAFGLFMRIAMFGSVPVQEDDCYRYLWDGALSANGINPWLHSPLAILEGTASSPAIIMLKSQAGSVVERINYGDLRSIYPAFAQAFFALAYAIEPFSLEAWRAVLLALEAITLGLVLTLLSLLNRPLIWSSLYWWNPVVIKEIMNSAHMEPVLMVPLLAALVLAAKSRQVGASVMAALAVATKVWPILVLPSVWRSLFAQPVKLVLAIMLATAIIVVLYWPIVVTQLDRSSGFVAFSTQWERISASFLILCGVAQLVPQTLIEPESLARAMAATLVGAIVLWSNRKAIAEPGEIAHRFLIAAAAMLLFSPVQLPWYFIWLAPLLCIFPNRGLLLMTLTFPLYYAFFRMTALGVDEAWLLALIWLMWLPVWSVLGYDWWTGKRSGDTAGRLPEAT